MTLQMREEWSKGYPRPQSWNPRAEPSRPRLDPSTTPRGEPSRLNMNPRAEAFQPRPRYQYRKPDWELTDTEWIERYGRL